MWPEIELVVKENRHELILSGFEVSERIKNSGIDNNLFDLKCLNLLRISDTILSNIDDNYAKLVNLQSLLLHSNKIVSVSDKISELIKLKNLDLSRNDLEKIPESIAKLLNLVSLNISFNKLEICPNLSQNTKLSVLDLSNNQILDFNVLCVAQNSSLSELNLKNNKITSIPAEIYNLQALKILNLTSNQIKTVPGELCDCSKLKEIFLQENPIQDKRFLKLIAQCRSKQVLDYIKQHIPREKTTESTKTTKKSSKKSKNDAEITDNLNNLELNEAKPQIVVSNALEEKILKIKVLECVKNIRPYILGCIIKNISFTQDNFRKFIQLQTKLHETVCDRRNLCTIATHDYDKIKFDSNNLELTYNALSPQILTICPLGRQNVSLTGLELFEQLKAQAESLRKEKKRNNFSGIHKYLHLLDGKPLFPCLVQFDDKVISFPPITNSEISKIDVKTQNIFVEITSNQNLDTCRTVLDQILRETLNTNVFGDDKLVIEKVKIVDEHCNFKYLYPSKNDLIFQDINTVRQ